MKYSSFTVWSKNMEKKNFKEELFREYELKRADALERKNEEIKKAYENCPELLEVDNEINRRV